MIELMLECDAIVRRLEQSAGGGGDPVRGGIGFVDGQGCDAPAHVGRPDRAPGQRLEPFRLRRGYRPGEKESQEVQKPAERGCPFHTVSPRGASSAIVPKYILARPNSLSRFDGKKKIFA